MKLRLRVNDNLWWKKRFHTVPHQPIMRHQTGVDALAVLMPESVEGLINSAALVLRVEGRVWWIRLGACVISAAIPNSRKPENCAS